MKATIKSVNMGKGNNNECGNHRDVNVSLLSTAGKGYGKIVIGRVQITRVGSVQSWEGLDRARDVWIRFLPRMIITNLMTKGKEMNVAFMDLKRDIDREQ